MSKNKVIPFIKKNAPANEGLQGATKENFNPYYPYFIKNQCLYKVPDKSGGDPISISRAVQIVEIRQNVDTKEVSLVLEYEYQGNIARKEITRDILTRAKVMQLMAYGVDVADHNVKDVLRFLNIQERTIAITRTHNQTGFLFEGDKLVFKHATAIGEKSVYNGDFKLQPKGSFDQWLAIIEEQVLGHIPLEFALILGLAAPVASLVGKETGLEVLVVHLYGNSSQGKTTGLRLAVSPFGLPHISDGGLIRTWNCTLNALLGALRNNHGIPLAFDEASMTDANFSKLIYMVTSGQDKERLNKDSQREKAAQWSGLYLSSGEHALTAKTLQNIGIPMRLMEVGNIEWTKSAEHADAIKEGLLSHYGFAGPKFVEWLLDQGVGVVMSRWKKWKQQFLEGMQEPDQFASRIADRMGILLATAEMAGQALSLEFNIEGMKTFLLKHAKEAGGNRDLGAKAYEYFMNTVVQMEKNFSTDLCEVKQQNEHWGKITHDANRNWDEIYILPNKFREIIKAGGFEDTSIILKIWKDRNLLNYEKNKLTRKKVLVKGHSQDVYVIKAVNNIASD